MDKDKPAAGPAYLKGYLEQHGFKVKVVDGNLIGNIDKLMLNIDKYEFKWLGISVFSYMQKEIALELGSYYENVIYGGPGVTQEWTEKNYIRGDGEKALLEFLNGNHFYPGINGRPPVQLDDLSHMPDYSDTINEHEYFQVVLRGSTGCVRNCTFCDIANTWDKFKFVDGKTLANNMHKLYEQTGVKIISFSDSLVNGSMKQFRELCSELASRETKIEWNGQFIAKTKKSFSEADFDNLAASGCTGLTIGIESGSESVRHHMRKKFSNEDLYYFVDNILSRGISIKFLLIVGYPTETEEDFEDTKKLLTKYAKFSDLVAVSLDIMRIEHDTPIETDFEDLFTGTGHDWENELSDLQTRFKRFIDIFEHAENLGYQFPYHAHNKKQRFMRYVQGEKVVL